MVDKNGFSLLNNNEIGPWFLCVCGSKEDKESIQPHPSRCYYYYYATHILTYFIPCLLPTVHDTCGLTGDSRDLIYYKPTKSSITDD